DPAVLEDDGMDHPAAEDLDPAGVLAQAAAGPRAVGLLAEYTSDVDLGARLDEREVARAQADRGARSVDALGELGEDALEMREGDVAVDEERLDLVEHRRVRRVVVAAVHGPRRDERHRRLHRLHRSD